MGLVGHLSIEVAFQITNQVSSGCGLGRASGHLRRPWRRCRGPRPEVRGRLLGTAGDRFCHNPPPKDTHIRPVKFRCWILSLGQRTKIKTFGDFSLAPPGRPFGLILHGTSAGLPFPRSTGTRQKSIEKSRALCDFRDCERDVNTKVRRLM